MPNSSLYNLCLPLFYPSFHKSEFYLQKFSFLLSFQLVLVLRNKAYQALHHQTFLHIYDFYWHSNYCLSPMHQTDTPHLNKCSILLVQYWCLLPITQTIQPPTYGNILVNSHVFFQLNPNPDILPEYFPPLL